MKRSNAKSGNTARRKTALRQFLALLTISVLCFSCCAAQAETPALPQPVEGVSPEDVDWDLVEEESALDVPELVLDVFAADDIPESYLTEAEHQGRVEKIYYFTTDRASDSGADGEKVVKSVLVYFPAGYDDTDEPYNVLYLLHGSNGSPKGYLNTDKPTKLQNLLDHLIEDGVMEPMIVVAATYYPSDGSAQELPLEQQVEVTVWFPQELVEDLIPQVEKQIRTYAASSSLADIVASRDHRGIAGFSLGGVATWYVFLQQMQAFKWFLPISEASWDDGEGGTSGIFDSDVSARTLYDAVMEQGYGGEDFMLFVAVGTVDEAFDISTNQMKSLLEFDDLFILGENTYCSMMIDGAHTASALYTYFYHILPCLFGDA